MVPIVNVGDVVMTIDDVSVVFMPVMVCEVWFVGEMTGLIVGAGGALMS